MPNETLIVGGTPVPVQVAESVQTITGEYRGDRTETFWYSPKLGVVVRYKIASSLKERWEVARIAPGHCTGEPAFAALRRIFGAQYVYAGLGTVIEVP